MLTRRCSPAPRPLFSKDCRAKLQKLLENAEVGTIAYNVTTDSLLEQLHSDMMVAVRQQAL